MAPDLRQHHRKRTGDGCEPHSEQRNDLTVCYIKTKNIVLAWRGSTYLTEEHWRLRQDDCDLKANLGSMM